jgi:nickel/cobalt transporter (NiCoT) family protein
MDTIDGAFMSHAYGWAFSNPIRKVYYNLTVTSLSVLVALVIGTIELLQVLGLARGIDFGRLGYLMVALFALTWIVSAGVWKVSRVEERWSATLDRGP